jgi:hypothetical protein
MVLLQFKILNTDISGVMGPFYDSAGSAFSGVQVNKQTNLTYQTTRKARLCGFTWVDSMGESKQPENHYIINLFSSKFNLRYGGNNYISFSNKQDHVNPSTSSHYEFDINLTQGIIDLNFFLEMFDTNGIISKSKSFSDSNFLFCILTLEIMD